MVELHHRRLAKLVNLFKLKLVILAHPELSIRESALDSLMNLERNRGRLTIPILRIKVTPSVLYRARFYYPADIKNVWVLKDIRVKNALWNS